MALDTPPLRFKSRNLAYKLETTTGTPIALSATEATFACFNPSLRADVEAVEREEQGASASPVSQDIGAMGGTCEFETEMVGDAAAGAPPPAWSDLFKMCGMSLSSLTFSPTSSPSETGTFGLYQAGRRKRIAGAMGNFVMSLRRGQPGRIRWNFRGAWQRPDSQSMLAPTYDTNNAPRVGAATFTIGGTTYRVPEVEIDKGNVVVLREDITAVNADSDAVGYRAAWIPAWQTIIRVSPEALLLSTQDWYEAYRARTRSAFACTIGATAGSIVQIAAPKVQLITPPDDEDRDGKLHDRLEFLCTRSADAGNDDLTITFA